MKDNVDIIGDDEFRESLAHARSYCGLILKAGPNYDSPGSKAIIYEHGRRNMSLRKAGKLPIICPVVDGGPLRGFGVFCVEEAEVRAIMDEDPGVKAGIFTYELHPVRGFPGASLPDRDP